MKGRGYVIQNGNQSVSQGGSDEGGYRAARAAKKYGNIAFR